MFKMVMVIVEVLAKTTMVITRKLDAKHQKYVVAIVGCYVCRSKLMKLRKKMQ